MFVQEIESPFTVDAVAALKEFDRHSIRHSKLRVEPSDFGEFVSHPLIAADAVMMSSFDHERAREHEVGHFGVIECVPEIPIGHLPFDGSHERKRLVG